MERFRESGKISESKGKEQKPLRSGCSAWEAVMDQDQCSHMSQESLKTALHKVEAMYQLCTKFSGHKLVSDGQKDFIVKIDLVLRAKDD